MYVRKIPRVVPSLACHIFNNNNHPRTLVKDSYNQPFQIPRSLVIKNAWEWFYYIRTIPHMLSRALLSALVGFFPSSKLINVWCPSLSHLPPLRHSLWMSSQTEFHHHGRFRVSGGVLPDAITAYRTYGNPTNPCIVFPTCYGGKLDSKALAILFSTPLIFFRPVVHGRWGEGEFCVAHFSLSLPDSVNITKVMDPQRYFVVTFALFSNGEVCSFSLCWLLADQLNVILVILTFEYGPSKCASHNEGHIAILTCLDF
jgi:hypothetical protein